MYVVSTGISVQGTVQDYNLQAEALQNEGLFNYADGDNTLN
jgi:hypothetical protein